MKENKVISSQTSTDNSVGQRKQIEVQDNSEIARFIYGLALPVYTCDLTGNIIYYNEPAVKLWGKLPKPNKDLWDASLQIKDWEGNVLRPGAHPMFTAIKESRPTKAMEIELLNLDGSTRRVMAYAAPTFDENGIVNGASNILIELDNNTTAAFPQKKHAELRTAQLEEANKELEAFSYTVSHDLQAPLRLINGFSKILANDYRDKLGIEARQHLEFIEKSARQMSVLVKSLLGFSKLGKAGLNYSAVDMDEQVTQIVTELNTTEAGLRPVIIQHELQTELCDPELVKQVWANLIGNAIKYSSRTEKPVIEIGLNVGECGTVYYVKDNGIGFDSEKAYKLFQPFQRMHSSDGFEGTGIGLATVCRIITKHGGKIWAEAKPNEGATFFFTLKGTVNESL